MNQRGFTFTEILIVLGVLLLFSAFFVVVINPVHRIQEARDDTREAHLNTILLGIEQKLSREGGWNCPSGPLPQDKFTAIGTGPGMYDLYDCLKPSYLSKYLVDPKEGSISGSNITDGLVGHWKFDEGSGTTAYDASGNENDAIVYNGSWEVGKLGNALSFNGTNSYMRKIGDLSSNFSEITIAGWIYSYGTNPATGESGQAFINTPGTDSFILHYRGAGFYLRSEDGTTSDYLGWDSYPSTNRWVYVTGTWDGTTMHLYQNGLKQPTELSFSGGSTGKLRPSNETRIGCRFNSFQTWFNGLIDDVRIYNRALSADEIQDLYNYEYSSKYAIWQNPVTKNISLKSIEDETKEVSTGAPEVALDLNKSSDNVYTPIPEGVVSTDSQYTISIRFKLKEIPSSGNTSGLWVGSDRRTGIDYNWDTGVEGDGLLRMGTRSPNARVCNKLVYHSDALSEWHMATLTYSSKYINCYHNGSFFQEMVSNDIEDLDDSFLRIGSGILGGTESPTIASFSDARIYDRALSAEEVEQLYKGYDIRNGLVGHWPLNEGQGTTAYDRSGNGNDGTLLPAIDGPTWTTK